MSKNQTATSPDGKSVVTFTPCSDCGQMVTIEAQEDGVSLRKSQISVHGARIIFKKYQEAGYTLNVG